MRAGLAILALALAGAAAALGGAETGTGIAGTARVIDGDTLALGPVRIRLHGIDAPELGQTCQGSDGAPWDCGAAAADRLAALIAGRRVTCAAREADRYGRIVATCAADGIDLGHALVAEGLAWAFLRYSEDYVAAEADARKIGAGLWQGDAAPAWDFRAAAWEAAAGAGPLPDCPIKGNINRAGDRIYHMPWSRDYARTVIDEARGERWFCDEAEAEAAGWRAARGR